MKSTMTQLCRSFLALIGIATIAVTGLTTPAQGADLGEALDSVKWRGILGTWVDSETKGERVNSRLRLEIRKQAHRGEFQDGRNRERLTHGLQSGH